MTLFFRDGLEFTGSASDEARGKTIVPQVCTRCGGPGWIEGYRHVEGGKCFKCFGSGRGPSKEVNLYTIEKLAKLNAAVAKKTAEKVAKAKAAQDKFNAEVAARRSDFLTLHGDAVAWLDTVGRDEDFNYREGFLGDMLQKAVVYANWSEGQEKAVYAAMDKSKARVEAAAASRHVGKVGERLTIEVTVERESSYFREKFMKSFYADNREEVYITTMRTADGSAIIVKSPNFRQAVGTKIKLKGTVKEHSDYKGEAQTVLTRAICISESGLCHAV